MNSYNAEPSLGRKIVLKLVGSVCELFLKKYADFSVKNLQVLEKALETKRPIITYTNHHSMFDDPVLWGMLPKSIRSNPSKVRWVLGAREICFTNRVRSWFFKCGQTLPIIRGDGINQPTMDLAIDYLNNDLWIHIFPEGFS
jgi:monolysocardiolipin acyltransferase